MVETVGEVGEVCSARVRAVRLMDGATVRVGSCMEGICGRSVLTRFRVRWWGQWEKCAQLVCEPCARVPGVHGRGHSKGGFLEGMCGRSVLSVSCTMKLISRFP